MPHKRPPHLYRERTRHGSLVWYVRRGQGPRTRLRAAYDSPEFWTEYRAAIEGAPAPTKAAKPGTLRWAVDRYRASSTWAALKSSTRRQRELIFAQIIETAGEEMLAAITTEHIVAGRERRAAVVHGANNYVKTLRALFAWATDDAKLLKLNPAAPVKLLRGPNAAEGFHTWTTEELARFEKRWPIGTRERLAFDLLLYTGLRRGDAVRLGRQHVRDGLITIRMEKTGEEVVLPLLPILAESIEATQTGDLAYLVGERGQPWTKESFGNWFKTACVAAKCPGTAHGLRKAGATRAAENGATEKQLMALFGWTSGRMATHYTRKASQKRLAKESAHLLMDARNANRNPAPSPAGAGDGENIAKISDG